MNEKKINRNKEIYNLYFYKKKTFSEISKIVNISISQVSRIIRKNDCYIDEKNRRIQENQEKHSQFTKQIMKKKRESQNKQKTDEKAALDVAHNQASCELSQRKTINNRAFKKWNSSIYEYYARTKEFRVKKEFIDKTSYAVPKKIKWD